MSSEGAAHAHLPLAACSSLALAAPGERGDPQFRDHQLRPRSGSTGPYKVTLDDRRRAVCAAPPARRPALDRVAIEIRGDTLVVRSQPVVVGRLSRRGRRAGRDQHRHARSQRGLAQRLRAASPSTGSRGCASTCRSRARARPRSTRPTVDQLKVGARRHRQRHARRPGRQADRHGPRHFERSTPPRSPRRTRRSAPKARRRSRPMSPMRVKIDGVRPGDDHA